jgi:hypothetical protein
MALIAMWLIAMRPQTASLSSGKAAKDRDPVTTRQNFYKN